MTHLIHVGFNNFLAADRIVAITSPTSNPIARLVQEQRAIGKAVDLTSGHKTKSVIFLNTGDAILSALAPETIGKRIEEAEGK